MKTSFALLFSVCLLGTAVAQDKKDAPADQKPADATEQKELAFVPAKIKEMQQINDAKLKTDAKYYIILSSASWCPPCRAEAPGIVKAYKRKISKDENVELVLFSADREKENALKWAKDEKMTYPIIFDRGNYGNIPAVQANAPGYVPFAIIIDSEGNLVAKPSYIEEGMKKTSVIVDADGKVIGKGRAGDLISDYKKYIKQP